jgi:branched-chain amino acid transport system ATP-binding protein
MPKPTPIKISGLRAGYLGLEVVHELNLAVNHGEIMLLLGPNGAGKTTTLLTIAGVLPALGGHVEVFGHPVQGRSPRQQVARGLAYVPEGRGLFHGLTAGENLRLRSRGSREAEDAALETFPAVARLRDRRAGLLSGGEQQMLALACAMALRPKAMMIDEMTLGLSPQVIGDILHRMRDLASSGIAILLVEQHVHAALEVADRVAILRSGHLVHTSSAAELRANPSAVASAYLGD